MNRIAALLLLLLPLAMGCSRDSVPAATGPRTYDEQAAETLAEVAAPTVAAADWPYWRGPQRNGVAPNSDHVPVRWSETENVLWKAPVPGRGHASPTIIGDLVVLATADEKAQVQSVIAFDRATGSQRWKTDVSQGGFPGRIHRKNTHASPTVVSDGERLFASFHHHDAIHLTALDLKGEKVWQREVGPFAPKRYEYGYAASPLIYEGLVIVAAEYDGGGYLTGLRRDTGDAVWKTPRPAAVSYSSPVVANVAGRDQLLISGCDQVASYNPATGEELWSTRATTAATCGTMVWDGDRVYASGGYPGSETAAVRADGSGKVLWTNNQKCYEQSMLAYDGHLYAVNDGGIAFCWDGETGEEKWKHRLRGPVSASPVLAGGNIYLSDELGKTWVFKADPAKFTLVAENQLGEESFATPTICDGRVYLRVASRASGARAETLYCIGAMSAE